MGTPLQISGPLVFPGYDENGDFIYDHSKTATCNLTIMASPFYAFARTDREFLFGSI